MPVSDMSNETRDSSDTPSGRTRVAILGGGPAGAVAALVLARAGVDTLVFESNARAVPKVGETLATSFAPMLERLELDSVVAEVAFRSGHANRAYWGSNRPIDRDFLFTGAAAGWQLDRPRFETSLATRARAAGAEWRWDHRVRGAAFENGVWSVDVEGPAGLTVVESVPEGWWYSAPLADGRLTVAYLSDADLIDADSMCEEAGWFDALEDAGQTRSRLAPWIVARDRGPLLPQVVHAGSACLSQMAGEGWLAIGDAAASFDPLSSQGIGWAMTTAYHGARAAAEHLGGNALVLSDYETLARNLFADSQQQLAEHYAVERRWPDATFWARRRTSPLRVGR
jgi:flavin-dependent dehydrogenase